MSTAEVFPRGSGEADAILVALMPVVDGIAATLGPLAEVVLHDFRRPDGSIIAIAGDLTDRHVGGSMSEIGMGLIAAADSADNRFDYVTTAASGRRLRSATFPLRDGNGSLFGALCFNLDVTNIENAVSTLQQLAGKQLADTPTPVTFTDDIGEVVDAILASTELAHGQADGLSSKDRLAFIRDLERRGVFSVRNAVPRVAAHLGVSRASVYSDLQRIRSDSDTKGLE